MVKITENATKESVPDVTFPKVKFLDDSKKGEIVPIHNETSINIDNKDQEPLAEMTLSNSLLGAAKENERRRKRQKVSENETSFAESKDEDATDECKSERKKRIYKGSQEDEEDDNEAENEDEDEKEDSIEIPIEDDADFIIDEKTQKQSNTYAAKKTVAQGMMDIALITANANQLRFMLEYNRNSATFTINVTLITISLLLQVAVGVSLIFKGRLDMRGESKHKNAKRINNYVVVSVFLVTIINVFIASFTVTGSSPTPLNTVPASNN